MVERVFKMKTKSLNDPRIEQIIEIIIQLAGGNLNVKGSITGTGDELDAIIGGLNMLVEEIHAADAERKQAEEQIKASLKEKEILLQEIHHRVKNNIQVISSLLKLQSNNIDDEQVKDALKASQSRVYAMSAIHETLYGAENLSEIDLKPYLSTITKALVQTYSFNQGNVKLNIESDEIRLNIEKASPLGLIINELITNSLKYAFPVDRGGEVVVILETLDHKELKLIIKDDGVGMPVDFDWRNSNTLGLQLVRTLVENQLDGSIDMENENGTKFIINFKIDDVKKWKEQN